VQKVRDSNNSNSLLSLCALAGYSRQSFYAFSKKKQKEHSKHELILQQVLLHRRQQARIGARKLMILLHDFLQEQQIYIGRDALFALLRNNGMLVRKRKLRAQTTLSRHHFRKYGNLVKGYEPVAPHCLWVSDITYLPTKDGFAYLSLITDGYSRKIVGYHVSKTLQAQATVKALQMALAGCPQTGKLIHHSDRGFQYCCKSYVALLQENHIKISMTENGDPRENAIAERVNGILKEELLKMEYVDFEQAHTDVAKAISIYNELRLHYSCDMLTPERAHMQEGVLKKHWKIYYKKAGKTAENTSAETNNTFEQ
jgi:putative transposase